VTFSSPCDDLDEFSVLLTDLKDGETESFDAIDGPSILIFTQLEGCAALSGIRPGP
jgi:uncharacterized protein YkuJ